MVSVLLLAVALAMDAFALSVVNGLKYSNYTKKNVVLSSFMFGFFQFLMPLIGYLLVTPFISYIEKFDHWIVLGILGVLGFNMIKEGLEKEEIEEKSEVFTFKILIVQAIATSIDALSVGVSLPTFTIDPFISAVIIGVITMVICLLGHFLGKKLAVLLKDKAVIFGGIVLICIGLKTVIEHLV